MFLHACRMGLEGIVAKRRDAPYRSGRCADWIKTKNMAHPAIEGAMLIALSKRVRHDRCGGGRPDRRSKKRPSGRPLI